MDIKKIISDTSKEEFKQVLDTYYSGNYNASILLLYNLLINDLYEKINTMLMDDAIKKNSYYKKIEKSIHSYEEKERYSDIELSIIDFYKNSGFFNRSFLSDIDLLKATRNLCAHPIIFREDDNHPKPDSDKVIFLINTVYKNVLTVKSYYKDPYKIIGKNIENMIFKKSIETSTYPLDFKNQVTVEYDNFKDTFEIFTDTALNKLFDTLITLIFNKKNDDTIRFQYKRFIFLLSFCKYMHKNNKLEKILSSYNFEKIILENICDDSNPSYTETKWTGLEYMYILINYNYLIKQKIFSNNKLISLLKDSLFDNELYLRTFFSDYDQNYNEIITSDDKNFGINFYLNLVTHKQSFEYDLGETYIKLFSSIPNFESFSIADEVFAIFLDAYKESKFSIDKEKFLNVLNSNTQIFYSSRLNRDSNIKELEKLFDKIDFAKYENLISE